MILAGRGGNILVSRFGPMLLLLAKKCLWFMTAKRLTNFNGNEVDPIKELGFLVYFFLSVGVADTIFRHILCQSED